MNEILLENRRQLLIQTIVQNFGYLSSEGQSRLLNDLKRTSSQYLCIDFYNGQVREKSVRNVGVAAVQNLKKTIIQHNHKVDEGVNWLMTSGVKQNEEHTRKAFKSIIKLCEFIYQKNNDILEIEILLSQLKGNKFSVIRSSAKLRYKSINRGTRLVGKQTKYNKNHDFGFVDEHVLPTNCLIEILLELISENNLEEETIDLLLDKYFIVKLNTDDDHLLRKNGLSRSMPKNWSFRDDNPFERYVSSGIDMSSIKGISKDEPIMNAVIEVQVSKEITNPQTNKTTEFSIKLGKTYYNNDFFNIPIALSNCVCSTSETISINLDGFIISGKIDRNSNRNGAIRIRGLGRKYLNYIALNFKLNDIVYAEFRDKKEIFICHTK